MNVGEAAQATRDGKGELGH